MNSYISILHFKSSPSYTLMLLGTFLSIFLLYSLCAFPTADDWGYGLFTPYESALHYYQNYHGRYFSNALISYVMSHDNFIFAYRFFFFLSYILFFIGIITTNILIFGNKRTVYTISLLLIAAFLFRLPAVSSSYYWLSAHCNYFFSINLFLYSFISFLLSKKTRNTLMSICLAIFSGIFSFLCIGCNEFYTIIMPVFWIFFLFSNRFLLKNKGLTTNYQLIIIILFTLLATLLASLAPGHLNRHIWPGSEAFSFFTFIKIFFLSFIDFFNSLLRIFANPLFLASFPLLAWLYLTSNNIGIIIENLRPYRYKIFLFVTMALLFPFTLSQYVVGNNITSRALVPFYFTSCIIIYFILFLYLDSKYIKNLLEKAFKIKNYLIIILFSMLPSVPFTMWLEIPLAFQFRKSQESRMKRIQKSYLQDMEKRNLIFQRIEARPSVLSYWDIQDKDQYSFKKNYSKFMKINSFTIQ